MRLHRVPRGVCPAAVRRQVLRRAGAITFESSSVATRPVTSWSATQGRSVDVSSRGATLEGGRSRRSAVDGGAKDARGDGSRERVRPSVRRIQGPSWPCARGRLAAAGTRAPSTHNPSRVRGLPRWAGPIEVRSLKAVPHWLQAAPTCRSFRGGASGRARAPWAGPPRRQTCARATRTAWLAVRGDLPLQQYFSTPLAEKRRVSRGKRKNQATAKNQHIVPNAATVSFRALPLSLIFLTGMLASSQDTLFHVGPLPAPSRPGEPPLRQTRKRGRGGIAHTDRRPRLELKAGAGADRRGWTGGVGPPSERGRGGDPSAKRHCARTAAGDATCAPGGGRGDAQRSAIGVARRYPLLSPAPARAHDGRGRAGRGEGWLRRPQRVRHFCTTSLRGRTDAAPGPEKGAPATATGGRDPPLRAVASFPRR